MAARTQPTMMGIRSSPGEPASHRLSSWKLSFETLAPLKASICTLEKVRLAVKSGIGFTVVVVFLVVVVVFLVVVVVFFVVVVVVVEFFTEFVDVGLTVVVVVFLFSSPDILSISSFDFGVVVVVVVVLEGVV